MHMMEQMLEVSDFSPRVADKCSPSNSCLHLGRANIGNWNLTDRCPRDTTLSVKRIQKFDVEGLSSKLP
jgi:hypothetical protein